ncbi:MAG: DUF4105 domain-containing protein [Muribaculaceae bacterium]|nr:DUF4105 domain-containing protein [Muribaculaceae bacterium]
MKTGIYRYILTLLAILLLVSPGIRGEEKRDSVVVSLITCWPGSEIYELCGHEALRVRGTVNGEPVDSVWNYGVFDYNAPGFVYRFVKGETDYMLAGYPFAWFLPEYQNQRRRVVEQDLNLSADQAMRLVEMLQKEGKPENRTYRYNYVRDNCATRIVDRIDSVAGSPVVYPDSIGYGTFRREMRAYHKNYPWYQFGIDLALGAGIDMPIRGREEMFVPVEMYKKAEHARFADGRPLIRATRVLNEGSDDAVLPPTNIWLSPLAVSWIWFVIVGLVSLWMFLRNKLARWIYALWFGICGLAGCLIAFLVFVSVHEATSPNVLLLWLNPLQLLMSISIWSRKIKGVSFAVAYYNIVALTCLLIVWAFQKQSANPAFFPLMGSTLLLAVTFAVVAPKYYGSNKRDGLTFNKKALDASFKRGGLRRTTGTGKKRSK